MRRRAGLAPRLAKRGAPLRRRRAARRVSAPVRCRRVPEAVHEGRPVRRVRRRGAARRGPRRTRPSAASLDRAGDDDVSDPARAACAERAGGVREARDGRRACRDLVRRAPFPRRVPASPPPRVPARHASSDTGRGVARGIARGACGKSTAFRRCTALAEVAQVSFSPIGRRPPVHTTLGRVVPMCVPATLPFVCLPW